MAGIAVAGIVMAITAAAMAGIAVAALPPSMGITPATVSMPGVVMAATMSPAAMTGVVAATMMPAAVMAPGMATTGHRHGRPAGDRQNCE
jgi:hypothetical protein